MNAIDTTTLTQQPARATDQDARAARVGKLAAAESKRAGGERAAERTEPPPREEMEALLERFARKNTSLSFKLDDESGRTVILVRDSATSEVIKQIPSEDMLRVAQRLEAHLQNLDDGAGLLLTDQV